MQRRDFLQRSALVSLTPAIPTFLAKTAVADLPDDDGRILVVIEMAGGNDGINTVVPYQDEGYAKYRDKLRIPKDDLIKLSGDLALHPRLRTASKLFEADRLSIVHGVGYPNPNRSHFESQRIWHAGSVEKEPRNSGNGWLGDAIGLDEVSKGPHAIHIGKDELPVALRGRRCNTTSIARTDDLRLRLQDPISSPQPETTQAELADFVTRTVNDAYSSAKELAESAQKENAARYPGSRLGKRLRTIGQLIKMDTAARVFYTTQAGYDTHASQLNTHANLLGELSSSLGAFMDDMRDSGIEDRVVVLAFSEFGRRVEENQSLGTDHGTAGPVFLCGTQLAKRQYSVPPSLTDLVDGDLKHAVDFRQIYASLLTDWLGLKLPATLTDFRAQNYFV